MAARKVALITGGGNGIGKAIAEVLAKKGYDIAITYFHSFESADSVCKKLSSYGVKAIGIKADLTKVEEVKKLFETFGKEYNRLDLFVNNAGITLKNKFLQTTEEEFDTMCDLNFKGSFFCMQNAVKFMIEHQIKGNVVVVSSNNGKAHFADATVYSSTKTALNKLSEHAALEFAEYGIRVNVIAPGWTDTGAERLEQKEGTFYKIPLKRWCKPEEIGQAVVFLDSESAASITGATIVMDGGAVLLSDLSEKYTGSYKK